MLRAWQSLPQQLRLVLYHRCHRMNNDATHRRKFHRVAVKLPQAGSPRSNEKTHRCAITKVDAGLIGRPQKGGPNGPPRTRYFQATRVVELAASPVDAISVAPVPFRRSLAREICSEVSQWTESRVPPSFT